MAGTSKDNEADSLASTSAREEEASTSDGAKQHSDSFGTPPSGQQEQKVSDSELDALLDSSLNDFGKHVPSRPQKKSSPISAEHVNMDLLLGGVMQGHESPDSLSPDGAIPELKSLEEALSGEISAEADAHLEEVMKAIQSENPELWKEFEAFASSVDMKGGQVNEDGGLGEEEQSTEQKSLEAKLEEALHKLRDHQASAGDMDDKLKDLLGQEGGDEGDEQLMKLMEGMMGMLVSKDILYPSLMELCSRYPEWLELNKGELGSEDKVRYTRQLEIMTAVCKEYDAQAADESTAQKQNRLDRIIKYLQELQQCGDPPKDLVRQTGGATGLPGPLPNLDFNSTQNCSIM